MKRLLLIVALSSAFATGAMAQNSTGQSNQSIPPRDQPFGKPDMGSSPDTMHEPNSASGTRSPEATTGMSQSGPSGPRTDGGGRDMSRPGGEGVSRKPGD
jgi:hypothetical protein